MPSHLVVARLVTHCLGQTVAAVMAAGGGTVVAAQTEVAEVSGHL